MKPSLRRLVRAGFAAALFALAATAALAQTLFVSNWGAGAAGTISQVTSGGSVSAFATTGFNFPLGLAFGSDGFLYVANDGGGTLSKVASNGTVSSFGSSITQPQGLAFDSSGNLFVANPGGSKVVKVLPNGNQSDFATIANNPAAVAFSGGTLYVASLNSGVISKVDSGGGVTSWVTSGLNSPYGLAFDTAGTLYVANYGNNTISKVTTDGVVSPWNLTFTGGASLSNPVGMTFAASGNLFVANRGANNVLQITPAGVASVFATGFNGPAGVAFAPPAIPEPSTGAALAGLAALGIAVWRRKRKGC